MYSSLTSKVITIQWGRKEFTETETNFNEDTCIEIDQSFIIFLFRHVCNMLQGHLNCKPHWKVKNIDKIRLISWQWVKFVGSKSQVYHKPHLATA